MVTSYQFMEVFSLKSSRYTVLMIITSGADLGGGGGGGGGPGGENAPPLQPEKYDKFQKKMSH